MAWFLVTIVLVLALATQRSKPARAVIVAALFGVLGYGIYSRLETPDAQDDRRGPTSSASSVAVIAPESIQATNLKMSGTGAPWTLTGSITNASDNALLSFTIAVTRLDCYAGALDASGCVPLWEGEQLVPLAVPPHDTRNFSIAIWPHNSVNAKGQGRDVFKIKAATGRKM